VKFKFIDCLLRHEILGTVCLQMKFQDERGREFSYQIPLQLGQSANEILAEISMALPEIHKLANPPA